MKKKKTESVPTTEEVAKTLKDILVSGGLMNYPAASGRGIVHGDDFYSAASSGVLNPSYAINEEKWNEYIEKGTIEFYENND